MNASSQSLDYRPFENLADDISVQICHFLRPLDILCLRRVCRSLSQITQTRTVWRAALERVCDYIGIFLPSFPLSRMSTQDLEHAATSPHRLLKTLFNVSDDGADVAADIVPCNSRVLHCRQRGQQVSFNCEELRLVPGGRFLLGHNISGSIHLWDLGYSGGCGAPSRSPYPIQTLSDGDTLKLVTFGPSSNPKGSELVIIPMHWNAQITAILSVYEIDPTLGTSAEWRLKGRLNFDFPEADENYVEFVHLHAPSVIAWCEPYFVRWNYEENTALRWKPTGNLPMQLYLSMSAIGEDIVVACDMNEDMHIWEVPAGGSTLTSYSVLNDLHDVDNPPKMSVTLPKAAQSHLICPRAIGTSSWQQQRPFSSQSRHLAFIHADGHMNCRDGFRLYQIRSLRSAGSGIRVNASGADGDPFVPPLLPVLVGANPSKIYGDEGLGRYATCVPPLWTCEDRLLLCTVSMAGAIVIATMETPTRSGTSPPAVVSRKLTPDGAYSNDRDQLHKMDYALCPFSGRLVYLLPGDRADKIMVSDYLRGSGRSGWIGVSILRQNRDQMQLHFCYDGDPA